MRKTIVILILTVLNSNNLFAQDIITKKDGTEIRAKIIEVFSFEIKYKEYDNIHGPEYLVKKIDITKIKYENGQEDLYDGLNPREDNRFGINANIGGPTILLSLSLDYFITPTINIETGFGFIGVFGGMRYHILGNRKEKNWTPYIGLYATHIPALNLFGDDTDDPNTGVYIPVGIQYLSKRGFTFGVEIAGMTFNNEYDGPPIFGAIKVGGHF